MTLPSGIEEIIVRAGQVRVRTTPALIERQLSLYAGGLASAFEPLADETADHEAGQFLASFPLAGTPTLAEAVETDTETLRPAAEVCEARVNALSDWMLANGETLQVRLFDREKPVELALARGLTLPPHRRPLMLRTAIACHRARAELRIEITSESGVTKRVETVSFDPTKAGGRFRSGYQEVAVPIPPADEDCTVNLKLAYLAYLPSEEDNDPFLFLADPEVTPRQWTPQILTPVRLRGAPVPGARWFAADIPTPVQTGSEPVRVQTGTDRVPVFAPRHGTVTLVEQRGYGIVMQADAPGRYCLFLDGKPAFSAHIGTGATEVRIPSAYLTGGYRLLSVRDSSGTQVFLETYVLMPQVMTPEDVLQKVSKNPFPGPLSHRAAHRYAALKAHMAEPGTAEDMAQISYALSVVESGHPAVKLKPLRFVKPDTPDVSVIIPAHNKVAVTYYALCALLLAKNTASFEVIVIDDASSDETAELESFVEGITIIRNSEPQRFIRANNAGVAAARGRYIALLNNDTEPAHGWLDALIDAFERFPRVGLVGSKLLYPDGTLQDAGGIIWGSGNPWNYGNRQNPWDPRFSYARQADYLSGAAMMTTRKIWDAVGGLSGYLEPMYFEDTDFAFKVREAGYTTWFVPASVVYHFEGITSGTDVTTGFKKYQELNRPKFKRRWAQAFGSFGEEGKNPDLEKDRGIVGRVLFLDYTTPCPDKDAGSYAAVQEMKLVQSLGYKVTFLPQNLAHLGQYTHDLEREGIETITAPFCLSIDDFLETRGAEFDAVYITRYYVGRAVIDKIRQAAPRAKILFNTADLHFLRTLRTALVQRDPEQVAQARAIRSEELDVISRTDVVLSYNEVENAIIQSHTDGSVPVVKCPWVVDLPIEVPDLSERAGISFLGSFNHHPNREGLTWFAREVMPLVAQKTREDPLILSVYGSHMDDEVRALATDVIDTVGFVETVADAYDRHRVFVAPLLSGAGIKGKVIAALAHGVPCVLSPVAAEGIGLRHGHDCLITESPLGWADAIMDLSRDDALWQTLSDNARAYVQARFSFATGRQMMRTAFEAVDLFGSLE